MKKLTFIVLIISAVILSCNNEPAVPESIVEDITIDENIEEVKHIEEITVDDLVELEADFAEFKNDEYKISFKYPSAWKTDEQIMPNMYFYEAVDKEWGVNFNITVGSDQGATLGDFKTMIDAEIVKDGSVILSSSTIKINEEDCNFTSVQRKTKNGNIIQNNYIIIKNGHSYMMNFTCAQIIYEANKDVEEYIISKVNID